MTSDTPACADRHVVLGALVDDGRLLMVHRINAPSRWDLPGGHVDDGESAAQALRRELSEELDIDITDHGVEPIAETPLLDDAGKHIGSLSIWRVSAWQGTPRNAAPDEHDDFRWLSPQELHELPLVPRGTELELLISLLQQPSP